MDLTNGSSLAAIGEAMVEDDVQAASLPLGTRTISFNASPTSAIARCIVQGLQ
jgi:hypothetical protein